MSETSADREFRPSPWDLYPTPEDWEALQGGMPRVFYQPTHPTAHWIVLHVYDQHGDAQRRFQNGAVLETEPPDLSRPLQRLHIDRLDSERNRVIKDIDIPPFMNFHVHGEPCEGRSEAQGTGYRRITTQSEYVDYLARLRARNFTELEYKVRNGRHSLLRRPSIRPARPLA